MFHPRSLIFNIAFYSYSTIMVFAGLPILIFGRERANAWIIRVWSLIAIFLLRTIVGTRFVVRGLENLPSGGVIIAAKHQSMFETFALFTILERPIYVMKRELLRIPLWGWYAQRVGTIAIGRDEGTKALRQLSADVSEAIENGHPVVIFPEGTRRPPGGETEYKGGVAHLYRKTGVAVVPVALNSGLFWPRHSLRRYSGTLIIEFLPPIEPGLKSRDFMARLENEIEAASDRLILEVANDDPSSAIFTGAFGRLKQRGRA